MCQMVVRRTIKERNYTVVDNTFINDRRLSWKSKGVFGYLLSLPENWKIYLDEIKEHASDGIDSLRSAIKELQQYGYVITSRIRDEDGKYTSMLYELNELPELPMPEMEKPHTENPHVDKPVMENPTLLNTNNKPNTNNTNYSLFEDDSLHSSSSHKTKTKSPKVISGEQLDIIKSHLNPDDYSILQNLTKLSEDSYVMTDKFNTALADVLGEETVRKLNKPRVKNFRAVFGDKEPPSERQIMKEHYLENKKTLFEQGKIASPIGITGGMIIEQRLNGWINRGLTFEQIARVLDFAMTDDFAVSKCQYDLQKILSDSIFNRLLNSPKCKAMQKVRPVEPRQIVRVKCPSCGEELDSFGKCVFCN